MQWNPRHILIVDHRGQRKVLCHVEDVPRDAPKYVKGALRDPGGEAGVFVGCACVFVLLFMAIAVGTWFGAGDYLHYAGGLAIIGLFWFGYMNRPMTDRAVIRAALAVLGERWCASCGYTLRDSEPESDGCTVCAECGAAWKLSPTALRRADK